jgi:hypothetical protein
MFGPRIGCHVTRPHSNTNSSSLQLDYTILVSVSESARGSVARHIDLRLRAQSSPHQLVASRSLQQRAHRHPSPRNCANTMQTNWSTIQFRATKSVCFSKRTHLPSGKYHLMVKGNLRALSSFMAI